MAEIPSEPPRLPPSAPASRARSRRRLIVGIATIVVAAALAFVGGQLTVGAVNAKTAVRYTSTAEHYSVMAPGEATQEKLKLEGLIPTTATRWAAGNLYYSVSSSLGGFPPSMQGLFLQESLVAALKHAPGVTASSLKTRAITDAFFAEPDEIRLSGTTAFETKVTVKGAPAPFHVVFAGHGELLYLLVFSDSADSRDKGFLDSFTFVN